MSERKWEVRFQAGAQTLTVEGANVLEAVAVAIHNAVRPWEAKDVTSVREVAA